MEGTVDRPVLLVDDNPDDVLITKRVWTKVRIKNPLYVANDGEEALRLLCREGEYEDTPTPCLILLDLNMPRMDGFKTLEKIKGDAALRIIPVIVLTSSDRDKDIERVYQIGCNSYIVKPVSSKDFIEVIAEIKQFWLTLNKIPAR